MGPNEHYLLLQAADLNGRAMAMPPQSLCTLFPRRKGIRTSLILEHISYSSLQSCSLLSVLMDLYIHPLYILFIKILSSILNSPVSIYPLYHHPSTKDYFFVKTQQSWCHFGLFFFSNTQKIYAFLY
jgi:hypothetical protein